MTDRLQIDPTTPAARTIGGLLIAYVDESTAGPPNAEVHAAAVEALAADDPQRAVADLVGGAVAIGHLLADELAAEQGGSVLEALDAVGITWDQEA